MSLFSRHDDLPGHVAVLRDLTPGASERGLKRLAAGDIVVIDEPDIERRLAQRLIDVDPLAIVNLSPFATGKIPVFGAQLLLEAGILLIEGTGPALKERMRAGKKARITDDGELYQGDTLLGAGTVVNADSVQLRFARGKQALNKHLESFSNDSLRLAQTEASLLIDGLGIPSVPLEMLGSRVVILGPGVNTAADLAGLRSFIREYEPTLIGVEEAADALLEAGYQPEIVVGTPDTMKSATLRAAELVVVPADADGNVTGTERIQDLGITAVTFPSTITDATDLAMLLADYHGAEMIVVSAPAVDAERVFLESDPRLQSNLLVRAQLGERYVSAQSIMSLYRADASAPIAWMWAVFGILVALAVIVLIAGTTGGGTFFANLAAHWETLEAAIQGWLN